MKIHVKGYREAMLHIPKEPTYVIRVFDPFSTFNSPKNELFKSNFFIEKHYFFNDIDQDSIYRNYPDYLFNSNHILFNYNFAEKIIQEFKENYNPHSELLVHCSLGASRSPAIAMALDDLFLLDDFFNHNIYKITYNRFVYRTMMEVGKRFI